jgi:hypothetical protein
MDRNCETCGLNPRDLGRCCEHYDVGCTGRYAKSYWKSKPDVKPVDALDIDPVPPQSELTLRETNIYFRGCQLWIDSDKGESLVRRFEAHMKRMMARDMA